ncbi:hypothetical protein [Paenibacillus larvae]|uniref:hypothetical protein n=1 Tax=Paenibacillus larvae TaxID=1464 RepID=UPI00288F30A9|nr:hypothetical protein [Paenibacillus larvae]MDT2242961.1 hypothetical protein [Paenibacillus larvae]
MFKSLVIRKAHLVATGFILLVVLAAILFFTKKIALYPLLLLPGKKERFRW